MFFVGIKGCRVKGVWPPTNVVRQGVWQPPGRLTAFNPKSVRTARGLLKLGFPELRSHSQITEAKLTVAALNVALC